MKKLTPNALEAKSPDLVAENVARLKALFPELVTEGPNGASVNVDVLKQLVGDRTVTDAEEKYGLNWHGKRRARQLALTPSTGTLRPCPEESVDWETTQNLMIEGDNLEVLKLLQKSYAGKVKLIYIDPPYNTGKDFVYPDNFQDNIKNYLELTGQIEGGRKISSNTETSGRFHTDWLNMMYPRLKLARNLLREDGILCISIGDEELANLKVVMNDVFGEENHRNTIALRRYDKNLSRQFMEDGLASLAVGFEYVLVFSRNVGATLNPVFRPATEERQETGYWKGFWNAPDRPTMRYVLLGVTPTTGQWKWKEKTAKEAVANYQEYLDKYASAETLEHFWERTGRTKKFIRRNPSGKGANRGVEHWIPPSDGVLRSSNWTDVLVSSSADAFDLPFPNPKNVEAIRLLVQFCTDDGDLVLDFFAGSGTIAHAVLRQNAADGGKRRYILVQLPEPLDPENKDQKVAAEFCKKLKKPLNIAELTKERLRRAGTMINEQLTMNNKKQSSLFIDNCSLDVGFRVFKLDSTNFREWEPNPENLRASLLANIEHLKTGRGEADILYELLLKLGLDLCVPMEKLEVSSEELEGKKHTVHAIGGGVLMACLSEKIGREDVELLGQGIVEWHKALAPAGDTTCVFRDSAFADDVAKTNMAAILEQNGIANVRSL